MIVSYNKEDKILSVGDVSEKKREVVVKGSMTINTTPCVESDQDMPG